MSAPSKPFAKGPGILLGIILLWAVSLALFLAAKMLLTGGGEGA